MKAIVLAAGYGTRMRGIIGDRPKALIEVGGRAILDHLLGNLAACCDEPDVVLVTNSRYYEQFAGWKAARGSHVVLLNDGSKEAGKRLGAVGDIRFAIAQAGLADDLLITAADNVFAFGFESLPRAFARTRAVQVGIWYNPDLIDQRRRGVVAIADNGKLTAFAEKPEHPQSHWAAAPLYLLPAELVYTVEEFMASGGNADAPGFFTEYLVGRHDVYGWRLPGDILDVGNPGSLAHARIIMNEES